LDTFVILSEEKKVHCKMRFFYVIQLVIAVDEHYLTSAQKARSIIAQANSAPLQQNQGHKSKGRALMRSAFV
jgi:hypothetical protein